MLHIRNLEEGVELFKVLGSDIRVNIILLLLKEKEMNMNEIAARLQITNGALTSHVRKLEKGYEIYATAGTATFLNAHGVNTTPVYWPDEKPDAENNVMKMIAEHKFDLIVNIPKNHTKRELTNGYKIRRGAIDHNIPLITNARLASAFIEAFCEMSEKDIQIKSWQDYK